MTRLSRKWRRALMFGAPVGAVVLALALYFGLNTQQSTTTSERKTEETVSELPTLSIFPQLAQDDFYDHVQIIDGAPVMTDEFIAAVVNVVLSRIQISDGTISWDYTFLDAPLRARLKLEFKWTPSANSTYQAQSQTYQFSLSS